MTEYIFYREDGTTCEVTKEQWSWVAQYLDGTSLCQFGEDGRFHQFREINQANLGSFLMVHETAPPLVLHWIPGMKLIHFYRHMRLEVGTPNEMQIQLYCFGYECAAYKVILVIMPDGGVVVTNDVDSISIGR